MAGIAWRVTQEVWHGLVHWGGTFVRTPKFRLEGRAGQWTGSGYSRQADGKPVGEIVLALYALGTVAAALITANYGLLPLTLIYASGFVMVAWMELTQARAAGKRTLLRAMSKMFPNRNYSGHSPE
jgi:hypothetical protein